MRVISILLLIVPIFSYADNQESLIVGKWSCYPYFFEIKEKDLHFRVTNKIEYEPDGTTTNIHTFKLIGNQEFLWFKTLSSGTWKIEGNKLTDRITSTKIIDGSIPAPLTSKNILGAISFDGRKGVSEIQNLTKTYFIKYFLVEKDKKFSTFISSGCQKV